MAGSDAAAAVQRARDLAAGGVAASLDLFGELVGDPAEADRVTAGYLALADRLAAADRAGRGGQRRDHSSARRR